MPSPTLPDDSPGPGHAGSARGATIPGTAGLPAFSIQAQEPSALPVVVAVPHAGRCYPPALLERMRHPESTSLRLEDRLADRLGEALARETGAPLIVAHAPRAMIDLNRAADDIDWGMISGGMISGGREAARGAVSPRARAASGLGLVPRRLPGTGEIWKGPLDHGELEDRLALIHQPYHAALADMLDRVRVRWGAALLIDLHSMPPIAAWAGSAPPEFVLGDRFGAACSGALVAEAFGWFGRAGRKVAHNRPYAGGHGLDRHAMPRHGIHGLQIEVDRRCYLDAGLVELGEGFSATVELLVGLVAELAARVAELGADRRRPAWSEAAE